MVRVAAGACSILALDAKLRTAIQAAGGDLTVFAALASSAIYGLPAPPSVVLLVRLLLPSQSWAPCHICQVFLRSPLRS